MSDFVIENGVLKKYDGHSDTVVIPEGVTSIGNEAFGWHSTLMNITIPDGVTSIGGSAFYGCERLTSITIPDSVTSIGYRAFSGCKSLTNITIPDSVMSIGRDAFDGCISLTSITIPDGVTSIADSTFYGCSSLTSITIPDGVTSIGGGAFYSCKNLTSITIPASVTSIGGNAFNDNPNLELIEVDSKNSNYISNEGILYNKDRSILLKCPEGIDSHVDIPKSVTSIGKSAFSGCNSLTSITIPDSVTSIGDWAFSGCESLTSITIPDNVTSIGESAFYRCESLTSITIPDSVTSIGDSAFEYCESLTSISIPDSVTSIGEGAFKYCVSLTSITIPDSVTSIEKETFSDCKSLTSISIPDSVTSIGNRAFYYCKSLTSITIPASMTSIKYWAFSGCVSLTNVIIPEKMKNISDSAFPEDVFVNVLSIPLSLLPKEYKIKRTVKWLSGEITADDNAEKAFSDYCKRTCRKLFASLLEANNPEAVARLINIAKPKLEAANEFLEQSKGNLEIHSIVMDYHNKAFSDKQKENHENDKVDKAIGLKEKSLSEWRKIFRLGEEGNGYSIQKYKLNDEKVEIPAQICGRPVVSIGKNAFYDDKDWHGKIIKEIVIPEGIERIGEECFFHCEKLETVSVPGSVKTIGEGAFRYCKSLRYLVISDGVEVIDKGCFEDCMSLKSVTIPSSVVNIDGEPFENCPSLVKIKVKPDNAIYCDVDGILYNKETKTLLRCPMTRSGEVVIQEGTKIIGNSSFVECKAVNRVIIPNSVKYIEEYAFWRCKSLKTVEIPLSVLRVKNDAFGQCSRLEKLIIYGNKTIIKEICGDYWISGLRLFVPQDSKALDYCKAKNIDYSVIESKPTKEPSAANGWMTGKVFVHTGLSKSDEESLENKVEENGGIVKSSTVLNTDYLVYNPDYDHETTKLKRARELQSQGKPIKIITYSEWLEMAGG